MKGISSAIVLLAGAVLTARGTTHGTFEVLILCSGLCLSFVGFTGWVVSLIWPRSDNRFDQVPD
jgi:hypothetical protein